MNNDKKLTAADLAMYLGCECQIEAPGDEKFTAIMTGADVSSGRATVLVNGANYGPSTYIVANIKPILRRLSDMTEEELLEFAKICSNAETVYSVASSMSNHKNVICVFQGGAREKLIVDDGGETWYASYFGGEGDGTRNTIKQHEQTVWLLRRHFDLFGWIDAGLALDAATLNEINEKP